MKCELSMWNRVNERVIILFYTLTYSFHLNIEKNSFKRRDYKLLFRDSLLNLANGR